MLCNEYAYVLLAMQKPTHMRAGKCTVEGPYTCLLWQGDPASHLLLRAAQARHNRASAANADAPASRWSPVLAVAVDCKNQVECVSAMSDTCYTYHQAWCSMTMALSRITLSMHSHRCGHALQAASRLVCESNIGPTTYLSLVCRL